MKFNGDETQYLKQILTSLVEKPEEFKNLPEVLQNNYKFIFIAVSLNGDVYRNLDEKYKSKKEIALAAIKQGGNGRPDITIYDCIRDLTLKKDKDIIIAQILRAGNYHGMYDKLPPEYKEDVDIKQALVAHEERRKKYNELCEKIKINADEYDNAPEEWKKDITFNSWAVLSNSSALEKVPKVYRRAEVIQYAYLTAKQNELLEKIKINADEYDNAPEEWKSDFWFNRRAIEANHLLLEKITKGTKKV